MITTRLLSITEYGQYAVWLKKLDAETRQTYFGIHCSDEQIDRLVEGVVESAPKHHFLVAEYKGSWIGTIHISESQIDEVEFGVIVDAEHRGNGIADRMMSEAIVWARNRGYNSLYMHCLSWNQPIKHLCTKYGMSLRSEYGETETKLPLPPADLNTITQEIVTRNRNVYRMFLQNTNPLFAEIYG
jgi:RimJ/RimL family protein N-acetyltransferase